MSAGREQPETAGSDVAVLEARGLGWAVRGKQILSAVDLKLRAGELVGVIGPNGAGKTTLLRLLTGVLRPTAGGVYLRGRPLGPLGPRARARALAFMTQDVAQAFPFTVLEVLLMGRYPHLGRFEQESAEDRERARRTLSYVGLSGLEERSFSELSGGERQLVLFARALVQDTDVLVLDEPNSNLDIRHQDRIFSMAQELARERRAVIASVHNLTIAAQYCSRLVLLERGTVAAEGRAPQVLRSEILDRVYEVRTLVTPSMATGGLTVAVLPQRARQDRLRVHVIGGAGSAVNLTRELYRLGHVLSGGIAHDRDSDEILWRNLGIPCVTVGAFSRISDADVDRASRLVAEADVTILCSFPVGAGNLGNLRLAQRARRLMVLAPSAGDPPRTFFSPEGAGLFEELCRASPPASYAGILDALERPQEVG